MERKIALAQAGAPFQELQQPLYLGLTHDGTQLPLEPGVGVERGREVVGWEMDG